MSPKVNSQSYASVVVFDTRTGPLRRDGNKVNLVLDR